MNKLFWSLIAKLVSRRAVSSWLIARAMRTPYEHIMSSDGTAMYMGRFWLFNPYAHGTYERKYLWCPWSIRIHHILKEDSDRDLHDHPWNARTIILWGSYTEQRLIDRDDPVLDQLVVPDRAQVTEYIDRNPGDTATLNFGEYHRIDSVSPGGVFTLFISGPKMGSWGFLVDGVKVPWRKYLGLPERSS